MGELETEAEKTRSEIASYLRELADQLDGDDAVTLELGGKQVQLDPTNPVTFKLEGESDWSEGDTDSDYCSDLPVRPHSVVRSTRNRPTVITMRQNRVSSSS